MDLIDFHKPPVLNVERDVAEPYEFRPFDPYRRVNEEEMVSARSSQGIISGTGSTLLGDRIDLTNLSNIGIFNSEIGPERSLGAFNVTNNTLNLTLDLSSYDNVNLIIDACPDCEVDRVNTFHVPNLIPYPATVGTGDFVENNAIEPREGQRITITKQINNY